MKRSVFFNLLFLFLVFACASLENNQKSTQKKWSLVKSTDDSKPLKRHEAAFVNVKDKFYLLGGRRIDYVSIFDAKTKKWTKGAKPPLEMHHFQPVVYKDDIYIIGALTGRYPAETPIENIYIYKTATDTWVKGDKIPAERLRGSTGNIIKNNIIYISCGIKDGHRSDHKKWLDSYNLKTKEWKVLPDAPRARDHFQAVEANNKIYVLAGRRSKAPKRTFHETIAEVDVFDIKSEKWTTLPENLPTQRAGNIALLYGKDVLVIGGESIHQKEAHNQVEGLNIFTHKWQNYPNLVQGRHGTGAFLYKDEIYIASGCNNRGGSPELNTMEKY